VPIQLQVSSPDDDDQVAVWGSSVNALDSRAVIKLDHSTGEGIAESDVPRSASGITDPEQSGDDNDSLAGLFVGLAIGLALVAGAWAVVRTDR
jgi:hypothetical protein